MSMKETADRLLQKKFGIFVHFLKDTHERREPWRETVERFDVPALARALEEIGAGWFFITMMQRTIAGRSGRGIPTRFSALTPASGRSCARILRPRP